MARAAFQLRAAPEKTRDDGLLLGYYECETPPPPTVISPPPASPRAGKPG